MSFYVAAYGRKFIDLTPGIDSLGHADKMQECIDNCNNTAKCCQEALNYINSQGNKFPADLRNALSDCIASCKLSVDYMQRGSVFHKDACAFCAEICCACHELCAKFDDAILVKCAAACLLSEKSCRVMAEHH